MRKRNWQEYNKQLIQRGSITFLIDLASFKCKKIKWFGRPQQFSDPLIMMLMMTKIHYHLTYRALQGFAESISKLGKKTFAVPTYSLICRRAKFLKLPKLSSCKPQIVALDASGIKIYGEGEWKVKIHGQSKRRKWIKVHIAVDPKTGEIVAQTTTKSNVHDGKVTQNLLDQVHESVGLVLADGAYDGQNSRKAIKNKKAKALIPPPKNARIRGKDPNRDDAIRIIRGLGGDVQARSLWGKLTGYNQRSLVETTFSRMKGLFGSRLFSKTTERQKVENFLRCLISTSLVLNLRL